MRRRFAHAKTKDSNRNFGIMNKPLILAMSGKTLVAPGETHGQGVNRVLQVATVICYCNLQIPVNERRIAAASQIKTTSEAELISWIIDDAVTSLIEDVQETAMLVVSSKKNYTLKPGE